VTLNNHYGVPSGFLPLGVATQVLPRWPLIAEIYKMYVEFLYLYPGKLLEFNNLLVV
jgi:hypothetical protein